jgi:hypothetical protein
MEKQKQEHNQKGDKTFNAKNIFTALGLGALVGGLVFAGKHFFGKKEVIGADASEVIPPAIPANSGANQIASAASTRPASNDNFPLMAGSIGTRIKIMQTALSKIMGKDALAKYTPIDGIFGSGTKGALLSRGYPAKVDQASYEKILADAAAIQPNGIKSGIVSAVSIWNTKQGVSGLDKQIITIRYSHILDKNGNRFKVRPGIILGKELMVSNGLTWFKAIDKTVNSVPSKDVKYV